MDRPARRRVRQPDPRDLLLTQLSNPGTRTLVDVAIKSIWGAEARDISLLFALWYIAVAGNETTPGSFARLVTTDGGARIPASSAARS